jgi:Raf kinase inhibitor-like YbhB/YbcL family protein
MGKQSFQKNYNRIRNKIFAAVITSGLVLLVGVSSLHGGEGKMTFTVTSPVFADGDSIPAKFTCEGEDLSPPLHWEGVPENTQSLVLIVDDPDAPDPKAPRMTWVHWVLYNMPPGTTGLPEGVQSGLLPTGTGEGLNDWKRTGYGGPCPPIGRHRYFCKLYALDTILKGLRKPTKNQVESAMQGHIIAKAEIVGTYEKSR